MLDVSLAYHQWMDIYTFNTLSPSHTIATTSRRPLTTTFFWVVAGGCQRSANVCRWSLTSRQLVVRELHRQPLADLRQPLFFGWFSEVFGGRQIGWQNSWSARGIRCSIENQTSRRHFCKHSLVGDRSPINRRSVADQSSVVAHHCFWLVTIRRLQNGMRLPLDWA